MLKIYSKVLVAALVATTIFQTGLAAKATCVSLGEKVSASGSLEAKDIEALKPYFSLLRKYAKAEPVKWESQVLKENHHLTEVRTQEIIDQLFDANSALRAEMNTKFLPSFRVPGAEMWNQYFRAYDNVVGFTDGYLAIPLNASRVMSHAQHIIDLGAGTANFSAIQEILYPGKRVDSLDTANFDRAKMKLKDLARDGQAENRFKFLERSLLSDWSHDLGEDSYDGAVMNNVLYNLADKETVLKAVYIILKSGSYFVLNDPLNTIIEEKAVRTYFSSIMKDALKNKSPMSEYDIALLGYINVMFLVAKGGASTFLTMPELIAKAQGAGFEVVQSLSSYYDMGSFLILRKP